MPSKARETITVGNDGFTARWSRILRHGLLRQQSRVHLGVSRRKNRSILKEDHVNNMDPLDASRRVRAACILDEFSTRAFQDEMDLVPIDPDRWFEAFKNGVDLLFVEAFWRGNRGAWKGIAYDYNVKERELLRWIVRWCQSRSIPTVFWNKEDPSHFPEFVEIASLFDHVYTTDVGMLPAYEGHGVKAKPLLFACQPALHNPMELSSGREAKISFAGSYMSIYPERSRDMEMMFDALQDIGIDIYDRNLDRNDPRYSFPERYRHLIRGTLKGDDILKAYKGYQFGMNLNSVRSSRSMFSRRLIELMACNTPVITNTSDAMSELFPQLVISSSDPRKLREEVDRLRSDPTEYRRLRLKALRNAMLFHTYHDRVGQMVSDVFGLELPPKLRPITCISHDAGEGHGAVLDSFNRQAYGDKELITTRGADDLARCIGECAERGRLIAFLRPEDHYGANYLLDMALAFFYSDAAMVTKLSHYTEGRILVDDSNQYTWVQRAQGGALMFDPRQMEIEEGMELYVENVVQGRRCLSIDEFNYVESPRGEDTSISDA